MLRSRGIARLIVCGVTTEVSSTPRCARPTTAASTAWCWRTAPALLSRIPAGRTRHDQGAGRHLRFCGTIRRAAVRAGLNQQEKAMSSTRTAATAGPAMWVARDWNGFFGLFTNVALNVIVLTGLCLGVVNARRALCSGACCLRLASRCRSATCSMPGSPGGSPNARAAAMSRHCPTGRACRICSS